MRYAAVCLGLAVTLTSASASAIIDGTRTTSDPEVVALLMPEQGGFGVCSGTIVKVASGVAYVLTAASCCTPNAPSVVVMGTDFSVGESYVNSPSSAIAPTYAVIPSSVKWDPSFNLNAAVPAVDDFCMLQFQAPSGTAAYAVATGSDGLVQGTAVRYVGFGATSVTNQNNTALYQGTAFIGGNRFLSINPTAQAFETDPAAQNGVNTCLGDTGGAVLLGTTLVGTIGLSDPNCQSFSVNARVTSETGSGGFISSYLQAPVAAPAIPPWAVLLLAAGLVLTTVGVGRRSASIAFGSGGR